jgi:uncharacterized protein (TIGR02145 family)
MRKVLSIITICCILFAGCEKEKNSDSTQPRCNANTPNWGEISFVTNQEWTITNTNGDATQIWSDAVQTSNCSWMTIQVRDPMTNGNKDTIVHKTTFGTSVSNADCRSNPNARGELFSWCAGYRSQNQFCPGHWRVPSQQDFIDLDIALGSTGNSYTNATIRNKYLYDCGGFYGGLSNPGGSLEGQGIWSHYWSRSNDTDIRGFNLYFSTSGRIFPQDISFMSLGGTLRCVRDVK